MFLLGKNKQAKKCGICVLIMSAILLTFSACGTSEKRDQKEPVSDTAGFSDVESIHQETADAESETEQLQSDTTEIKLTFGNEIVFAMMDNSETTKAFLELLPLTLSRRI